MNCKEFEKMIPDFMEQKLDYNALKNFSRHMSSCDSCKEELTIQFLVTEGMQRLEDGEAFDLQRELNTRLLSAKKQMKWHKRILHTGLLLELLGIGLLVMSVFWLFL